MAIPKRVIDTGVKTAKEISRKAYGVGVVHGTKKLAAKVAHFGGVLMHSTDPNARKIGSQLLHMFKRAKKL